MLRTLSIKKSSVAAIGFLLLISIYPVSRFFTASALAAPSVLRGHTNSVSSIDISGDGRLIASGSLDRTIRVWDAQTGKSKLVLRGHKGEVYAVAFSPDGQLLASSGYDRRIIVWNIKSGKPAQTLELKSWSVAIAFSPDSRSLAVGSQEGNTVVFDAQTGNSLQTLETGGYIDTLVFSPDGRRLATANGDIVIWDLQTGRKIKTLEGHQNSVTTVKFSKDNRFLASASRDKTARVWNAESGEIVKILETQTPFTFTFSPKPLKWKMPVTDVAFSPDGKTLAMATGRAVHLWEISTGNQLRVLEGHTQSVTGVAFMPDGRSLVSGSLDGTIRLWALQ